MKKLFTLITLSLLLSTGCRETFFLAEQEVYFQYEYINHAWGYQHSGFFIDKDGHVLEYELPDSWNFPDEYMIIPADLLHENISKCKGSGKNIPLKEVERYASYIPNIASSKLTSPKREGADMGTFQFVCYQLLDNGKYKIHLISQEGDFSRENLNFYSKRVVAWMKEIAASLPR